jgi:hypothetical protein
MRCPKVPTIIIHVENSIPHLQMFRDCTTTKVFKGFKVPNKHLQIVNIDVCGVSTNDPSCDDPFPNFPPPRPKFEVPKFPMMTSNKFQIAPINVQRIP